jgi:hypothetical protein
LSQYNFEPEISRVSRIIGRDSNHDVLINESKNSRMKKLLLKKEMEKEITKNCTFKPDLATKNTS